MTAFWLNVDPDDVELVFGCVFLVAEFSSSSVRGSSRRFSINITSLHNCREDDKQRLNIGVYLMSFTRL